MRVSLALLVVLLMVMIGTLGGCSRAERGGSVAGTDDGSLEAIAARLPADLAGWRVDEEPGPDAARDPSTPRVAGGTIYDRESIFDYIDGHAEVYLAYGMRGCLSRRYAGPRNEPDLVLDVFELASPADAFGVMSHQAQGDPIELGQGGRTQAGWISFWKGPYYVSLYAEDDTAAAAAALRDLAHAADGAITETGTEPELIGLLPADGLDRDSVVFLRHHVILASHLASGPGSGIELAAEPVLELGPETAAVLASYSGDAPRVASRLLVIEYADDGSARRAAARAQVALGTDQPLETASAGGAGASREPLLTRHDDGTWSGVSQVGRGVVIVLGATGSDRAAELLGEASRRAGQRFTDAAPSAGGDKEKTS